MKRLLLPFLFLLFLLKTEAQITFCPPGAKWTSRFEGQGNGDFLTSYNYPISYIGDSIVGGDTLKMLEYRSFFRSWNLEQIPRICFIKQKTDTIFMRNIWTMNQWQVLYNFAALPGHSWINSFQNNSKTCTTTVNSVDTVMLNNKSVRRLKVTYEVSTMPYYSYEGYILEHVGSDAHLFNYRIKLTFDAPEFKELLCYSDLTIGTVQFGPKPCYYSDEVGIEEQNLYGLKIYPNPVNSALNIEGRENINVLLSDVNGKLVKQEQLSGHRINIADLTPGIYFLQIKKSEELVYKTKIVKE